MAKFLATISMPPMQVVLEGENWYEAVAEGAEVFAACEPTIELIRELTGPQELHIAKGIEIMEKFAGERGKR